MCGPALPAIVQYYQEFKAAIFASSLTLGTFLFTMKTFIIQTMKREVYDRDIYQEKIAARRAEGKLKEAFYGQLINFKRLLFWTIVFAFINALLQLCLGYYKTKLCAIICFSSTGTSWILTIIALVLVSKNLSKMILISENMARDKFK
jgi:hypothetical protein